MVSYAERRSQASDTKTSGFHIELHCRCKYTGFLFMSDAIKIIISRMSRGFLCTICCLIVVSFYCESL